jgi:hypothetical protein
VNQAVSRSASSICGMKLIIQIMNVFPIDSWKEGFFKIVSKFWNGLSRNLKVVFPKPLKSVKPITAVYNVGYKLKIRNASTKGIEKIYPYLA